MHDSGRYDYITFGWIATIIGLILLVAVADSHKSREYQSSYYAERCANKHPHSPFGATYINPLSSQPKAAQSQKAQEEEPDWCDLAAQQSVAEDTAGMHRAAWAGVVFTWVGIFFVWQTLIESRKTTVAAINGLRASQAEIGAKMISTKTKLIFGHDEEGESNATIEVCWENVGKTFAYDVEIFHDFVIITPDQFGAEIEQFNEPLPEVGKGRSVAPNDPIWLSFGNIDASDVRRWEANEIEIVIFTVTIFTDAFGQRWMAENCNSAVAVKNRPEGVGRYRLYPHHNRYEKWDAKA